MLLELATHLFQLRLRDAAAPRFAVDFAGQLPAWVFAAAGLGALAVRIAALSQVR